MPQLSYPHEINSVILDIEGTICPISFVHDILFPYFLSKLDPTLQQYTYPITNPTDEISTILADFPNSNSAEELSTYIKALVSNDVKDPVLKKLQGYLWLQGYQSGQLSCPIYPDVITALAKWRQEQKKVYIYSSGSVKAQKLLLQYNDSHSDLNEFVEDYFDTVNIGSKLESKSYEKIAEIIQGKGLFLSDNVNELLAAETHVECGLVVRPGNNPAEYKNKISTFDDLI